MTESKFVLSDRTYAILKWVCIIALPALGTLYFGLSQLWGLPEGDKVVQTTTLLGTVLGVLVGISNKAYNGDGTADGILTTTSKDEDTGNANLTMVLNKLPEEVMAKKTVRLKVDPNAAAGTPPEL